MEGDLREFSLPEILQFISLGSRSGVLEILLRDDVFGITFTSGIITGLTKNGWTLIDELASSEFITAQAVTELIKGETDAQAIQTAAFARGWMTEEEWSVFTARQIERLLYSLFDVRDGTFRFRHESAMDTLWLPVHLTADRAVLEGTHWSEAWSRAGDRIPSRHSWFTRTPTPPSEHQTISAAQWHVYVVLSVPASVNQIMARSVLTEVEVVESLYGLLTVGLVIPAPQMF